MKRSKQLKWNTIASLAVQVTAVFSSFVVPQCILRAYGSNINGLVSSITGFLGFLSLMESGVGNVARAELYRPVAEQDTRQISIVVNATHRFFHKVALLYVIFVVGFAIVFPFVVETEQDFWYTFTLVLIIAVANLVQYYFGAGYMQVLYADQKIYILYSIQAAAYLLSVILTVWLTQIGASIHMVKITSAMVFIVRPLVVNVYVKRKYALQNDLVVKEGVLTQKWNNMLQTIAYFVHSKTDVMVLTVFCTLKDISVYSIYSMVTTGLSSIISSLCNGFTSKLGSQYGKRDERVQDTFSAYELFVFNLTAICFVTAACVIQSFISIYTSNVKDAQYNQPVFAVLMILAEAIYCLRMPYNNMVSAAGHFRQTQLAALMEAGINIVLSVLLVWQYGLVGVAVGTLVAMAYRTLYLVVYLSYNILCREFRCFLKKLLSFGLAAGAAFLAARAVSAFIAADGYFLWAVKSMVVMVVVCAIVGLVDIVLFPGETKELLNAFGGKKAKK